VVEVDGDSHFNENSHKYDQERTTFLESLGLTVIRFTNQEVLYEIDAVHQQLSRYVSK
jgi:very-short-patch-repair endonuclease